MNYSYSAQTHPGMVRSNNEDAALFDPNCGVAVLADGMGGYNAGEIASGMATTFIKSELARWLSSGSHAPSPSEISRAMELCVKKTNLSIFNAATSNPSYAGMGTTLVLGVFQGHHLVLGHVGDSRCYRLRKGILTQITKDHSMLQEQVDAGLLTVEQAATAPGKNLLTRAIGVESTTEVEIHTHDIEVNDLYLMCSDGLTDMVKDATIAEIIGTEESLTQIAANLIAKANMGGGRDNITVLLTQAKAPSDKPGLLSRLFGSASNKP
jgi:protein phosphatase